MLYPVALGSTRSHEVWVKLMNPHRGTTQLTELQVLAGKRLFRFYISDDCRKSSRLCSEELSKYPRLISKLMRYHEERLLRVLKT
jgi:hypothetical protein